MASFSIFYKELLHAEGGYQADKNDKGNFGKYAYTYAGIAGGMNPQWVGFDTIEHYKAQWKKEGKVLNTRKDWLAFSQLLHKDQPLQQLVYSFYKALYWNPLKLDQVNSQAIANQICDHGVNAGIGRLPEMIQYVLRNKLKLDILVDGVLGPKTLTALNSVNAQTFFTEFKEMRKSFYRFRTGQYNNVLLPIALQNFFSTEMKPVLTTNTSQKIYLRTWLTRVDSIHYEK